MLGQRPHFRDELARKLLEKGHPASEVEAALERAAELGYLDDAVLAREEAARLGARKGLGRAGVVAELRRKGAARAAVAAVAAGGTAEEERARAQAVAVRWLRSHRADAAALARHLERKGYARSLVYRLVTALVPAAALGEPEP
ncbi:MAG TPA: RecX family transcriptional regulator [Thermoanaerobaculia bacterium]